MIYWRLDSILYYHPPHPKPHPISYFALAASRDCWCPECSILNNGGRAQYKLFLKGQSTSNINFSLKRDSSLLHTRANPGCTIQCTLASVHSLLMILLDPPPFFMASYQKAKNWGNTMDLWLPHFDCCIISARKFQCEISSDLRMLVALTREWANVNVT